MVLGEFEFSIFGLGFLIIFGFAFFRNNVQLQKFETSLSEDGFFCFETDVAVDRAYMTLSQLNLWQEMIIIWEQLSRLIRDANHYHNIESERRGTFKPATIKMKNLTFSQKAEEIRKF